MAQALKGHRVLINIGYLYKNIVLAIFYYHGNEGNYCNVGNAFIIMSLFQFIFEQRKVN